MEVEVEAEVDMAVVMEVVMGAMIVMVMDPNLTNKKRSLKITPIIMVALLVISETIPMKNLLSINTKTPQKIIKILVLMNLKKKRRNTNNLLIPKNHSKK
jgi:hypothetical protein